MANKYLVDSSVLIGLFDAKDRLHARAKNVFLGCRKKKPVFVIHPLVYIETLSVTKYKQNKGFPTNYKETKKKLDDSNAWEQVNWSGMGGNELALELFDKNKKMGLVDTILIQDCQKLGYELVTFDKEMEKEWKRIRK